MAMNVVNVNINKKQTSSNRISDIKTTDRSSQPQSVNVSSTGEEVVETEELDLSIEDEVEVEESNNAEIQEEVEETEGWSIGGMLSGAWDSVTGFVEEVGETATEILTDVGNAVADTGATLVGGIETLWEATTDLFTGAMETIASWGSALFEWGTNRLTDVKEFAVGAGDVLIKSTEKINEILQATGATVATIGLGLVEGILEFGEAIVDAAVIILGAVATIVTGIIDIGAYLITGEDLGLTSGMWDGIMGFVSEQWVSGAFDMLYEDTGAGRWIAENAVGFETARGISSGIGYVAGMIALTVATCGAGTAPTIAGTISSTAAQGAVIAGVAGFGQGAEESWGNGATLKEGLGYAGVRGIYEGVSYYLGGKMSGVVLGEGVSAVSRISTSALRIGFDALDGGLSGVIDPAAKMIYNDKSYRESFEENGGWQAVATNATIGAGMSSFGEIADNIKIRKTINNTQINLASAEIAMDTVATSTSNENVFGKIRDLFTNKKNKLNNSTDIIPRISYKDNLISYIKEIESEIDLIKYNNSNITRDFIYLKDKAISATIIKKYNYITQEEYNNLFKNLDKEIELGNFKYITNDESYRNRLISLANEYTDNNNKLQELEHLHNDLKIEYNKLLLDNVSMAKEKLNKLESFFEDNNTKLNEDISFYNYGVDQGIIKRNYQIIQEYDSSGRLVIKRQASADYIRVKETIAKRYNMDYNTTAKVMAGVDSVGACSYAATANEIFASYIGKEQQFFNDFGFSMYVVENGKKRLNSMELLTDMYICQNMQENGGNLLIRTLDGKIEINPSSISSISDAGGRHNLSGKNQEYMSGSWGISEAKIDKYLKSKNPNLEYKSKIVCNNFSGGVVEKDELKKIISTEINNGKIITLDIFTRRNEINMYNMSGGINVSTKSWNEGGGHAIFVTGLNDQGVIVSSWGAKYLIPYSDLREGSFVLNSSIISKN